MKLSDYKHEKTVKRGLFSTVYFGSVLVTKTTGALWWEKTTQARRRVFLQDSLITWRWLDGDEKDKPDWSQMENLYLQFKASLLLNGNDDATQPNQH